MLMRKSMDNTLILFIFVSAISCTIGQDCGQWSAYDGSCYTVERDAKTWHDAESWCLTNGGHLASLENEAERDFIHGMSANEHVWIGLNQLSDRNGNYRWSDGATSEFRDWAPGQPVEGGLEQCVYTEVFYTHPGDCFDRNDGRSTVKGLIDKPDDASPPDTFFLGVWDEEEQGIQLCMEACRDYGDSAECHSYTFTSTFGGDPDWTGTCVGRSDQFDVDVGDLWSYSGSRMPCRVTLNTSNLWYSSNCGAPLGFVCKKPADSGGPITVPPPQDVNSYCPQGYFNIAGGNKCFKVVTTLSESAGKTWDEALQECRAGPGINPDLASISSEVENAEILAAFKNYSYGAWLGYFVDVRSELFLWADNSNPVFENWDDGQPQSPESKTCTEMWIHPGKPGTWSSLECGTRRGYVCQTFKDADNPIDDTPSPAVSCEPGWMSYWYACYKLNTEARTWQEAEDACVADESHLVSIHSEMENSAVFALIQHVGHIWMGFKKVDDKYLWTDDWVNRYTNWGDGGTEGGEGCVEMLEQGKWKDEECSKTHPYVCKYSDNAVLTTPILIEGFCPEGWSERGGHCYSFNFGTTLMTWDDADINCQESAGDRYTGHLASVHSFLENEFLLTNLKERTESESAWIGCRRNTKEDWFDWSDGTPTDYEFWAPDRPDGDDYDIICGEILLQEWQGGWNDEQCPSVRDAYVCKTPKAPKTTPTPTTTTTTPTLPPPGGQDCPGGAEKYGDVCYTFHPNDVFTFEDAIDACVINSGGKGTLASIHDETENWFIHTRMQDLAVNIETQRYWIGLKREEYEACFTQDDARNRISGIIDRPSDASPPDTFNFGKWSKNQDDVEALEWCKDECRKIPECFAYNFDSVIEGAPDSEWKGYCVGRSIDYDVNVASLWSYSGERIICPGQKNTDDFQWINGREVDFENWTPDRDLAGGCGEMIGDSGQWDDVSCGTEQGYVCRWQEDGDFSTVPVPSSTTTSNTTTKSITIDSTTTTSSQVVCPSDEWVEWGDNCYLFAEMESWEDARSQCLEHAGDLVSILSAVENRFIAAEMSARDIPVSWIGLFQNETDTAPGPFEYFDYTTVVYGVLTPGIDRPSDADGIDTFYFGGGLEYNEAICKEQCADHPACAAYSWYGYHWDFNWEYACVGRSDKWNILEYDDYSSSGIRSLEEGNFTWTDSSEVNFTSWAPDEPSFLDSLDSCTNINSSSEEWYTSNCSTLRPYVCKVPAIAPTTEPEPERSQPQYQVRLATNFSSTTGEPFSQQCVVQYASSLNQKALQVSVLVNSRIGSHVCTGVDPQDIRIVSASCPMTIDVNKGITTPTFYLSLGSNLLIESVENCVFEIVELLLPYSNWGEPLIPNIPGCPGVSFEEDQFLHDQDQWMCLDSFQGQFSEKFAVPLRYGFSQSGSFSSESGEDVSIECMNRYNTEFNLKTFEMVQTTNDEINSGQLCGGFTVAVLTSSAFLLVDGNRGLSSQSYALQPSADMMFSDVYQCTDEISGFLGNHDNWVTPILPQLPGCPALMFDPELFQEMSQNWICVPAI